MMEQTKFPALTQVVLPAFRDWITDWPKFILVTVVWLLSLITFVFAPPFTFGLFYVTKGLAYGDIMRLGKLWEGTKKYFWTSWWWLIMNVVVIAVLVGNILFYGRFAASWSFIVQLLLVFLLLFWLIVQFYTIPYLMEQTEKSLKTALRNAVVTFFSSPGFTIVVVLVFLLLLVLSVVFVFPIFLGVPCLLALIWSRAVRQRIKEFNHEESI